MDQNDSNARDIDPDWKKVERAMTKVGLKNGLSDGRETNFQQSFDQGYEDGFRNGFSLGLLKYESEQKKNLESFDHLEKCGTGMCIVCTVEKDNDNVADIREKQNKLVNSSLEKTKLDLDKS